MPRRKCACDCGSPALTGTEISDAEANPQSQDTLPFVSNHLLHPPSFQPVSFTSQFLLEAQGREINKKTSLKLGLATEKPFARAKSVGRWDGRPFGAPRTPSVTGAASLPLGLCQRLPLTLPGAHLAGSVRLSVDPKPPGRPRRSPVGAVKSLEHPQHAVLQPAGPEERLPRSAAGPQADGG